MLFRKKRSPRTDPPAPTPLPVDARVLESLQTLEKAGVQLLVRAGGAGEPYTSEVVGLGRDAFFIDTLSPPEGDRLMRPNTPVEIESLYRGMVYTFRSAVLSKVQFVDELPAFRMAYPLEVAVRRRRQSPRVDTRGDASLSFLHPFRCDAPVVNLSEGGLAFEYPAEAGRLRKGTVIRNILLELGAHPVVTVHGKVVFHLVVELGALSLPSRYRASLAFQGLPPDSLSRIRTYLAELQGVDARA
ncbi:MAG: hypothetical protein Kow0092_34840 [Deferrisomatales bacterium]